MIIFTFMQVCLHIFSGILKAFQLTPELNGVVSTQGTSEGETLTSHWTTTGADHSLYAWLDEREWV